MTLRPSKRISAEEESSNNDSGDALPAIAAELAIENMTLRNALRLRDCALDAATSGFLIIDMLSPHRPIVFANRALARRTGYSNAELLGMPSANLTRGAINDGASEQIRDAMQSGRDLRIEYQTLRKDGTTYWTGSSLMPVYDEDRVTHYVSISADITLRREAELQSQKDRQRLVAVVESAIEGVIAIDDSHCITLFNRAAEKIFGYAARTVLGQPISKLLPPKHLPKYRERLSELEASESSRHKIEVGDGLTALRANGEEFAFEASISRVRVGEETVFTVMLHDMSDEIKARKERQQLEGQLRLAQKLEAVGQLAAGIAHEINTPIQYIGDSVAFLQTSREDGMRVLSAYRDALVALEAGATLEEVKANVRAVEKAVDVDFYEVEVPKAFERTLGGVEHVANIVRAMKEFSHPDPVEQEHADVNQALQTTLIVARNEYKYVATVETHLQELPPVMCNISELNQVFLNLIVNAAHAIEETGKTAEEGRIVVTSEVDGAYVKISVRDNGCGIPEENVHKVFDPFFTTKEVGKGTGQGLAITQSIVVAKHGGTVDIDSKVGAGTAFVLRLPITGRAKPEAIQ